MNLFGLSQLELGFLSFAAELVLTSVARENMEAEGRAQSTSIVLKAVKFHEFVLQLQVPVQY